jgi:periplasmic copper chaperone A
MSTPVRMVFAALCLASVACSAQVTVDAPWVRGTVAGQSATGAFMDLKSGSDLTLVGAASPIAGTVQVHAMEMHDGMMHMHGVERLPLPAGKTVRLAPGGYHLMLMDLKQPLADGDSVPISLTFEDASRNKQTLEVNAPVRGLGVGRADLRAAPPK